MELIHMVLALQYAGSLLFWFTITFLLLSLFRKKHITGKQDIFRLLLMAYIVGICSVTLFPAIDCGIDSAASRLYISFRFRGKEMGGLNLVPFKTILSEFTGNIPELGEEDRLTVGLTNLIGSICLYLPIGFLLPLSTACCKRFGSVLIHAAALSCIIEILQVFIGRSADIDDVFLQLLGTAIGYGIWQAMVKLTCKRKSLPQNSSPTYV